MKTWRWMLVMLTAGTFAAACTVESNPDPDDDGGSNVSSSSAVVSSSSSSSVASSTTSTTMTCNDLPSFGECADCHCNENMTECNAYITAIINNIYCGQTCGATDCAMFCADPQNNEIDMACDTCSGAVEDDPNNMMDDVDNFVADCTADQACLGFAQILQGCPE